MMKPMATSSETAGLSMGDVHGSVRIAEGGPRWRRWLAYAGPGYIIAVGYMDPGNWATDIAAGSAYGYRLLAIVLLASLMAMVLQALSAWLGIGAGRDLAQLTPRRGFRPKQPLCFGFARKARSSPATWRR